MKQVGAESQLETEMRTIAAIEARMAANYCAIEADNERIELGSCQELAETTGKLNEQAIQAAQELEKAAVRA